MSGCAEKLTFYGKILDFHVYTWYNITIKGKEVQPMANQKKKKPTAPKIEWTSILVSGAVDFFIGLLLLIIEKIIQ
jgi:hypothetical protein